MATDAHGHPLGASRRIAQPTPTSLHSCALPALPLLSCGGALCAPCGAHRPGAMSSALVEVERLGLALGQKLACLAGDGPRAVWYGLWAGQVVFGMC